MSQVSVAEQGRGYEGGKAGLHDDVISRSAEGKLYFGRLCVLGTDQSLQAKLPAAATDVTTALRTLGVSVRDLARENSAEGEEPHYEDKDSVAIMRKGDIYLKPEEAVTPLSALFVRFKGKKQVQTITLDADLVTGNTVNGSIGGIAIPEVTFASTHDATMGVVVAAILAANPNVLSAALEGGDNREITVITRQDVADQDLGGDWVVAAGASQAGVTEAETQVSVNSDQIGKVRLDADNDEAAAATAAAVVGISASESVAAGAVGKFHLELA